MLRLFRLLPETGIFHFLTRGNNRQKVFKDRKDYQHYLHLLKLCKEEHRFLLYHYCLMLNHLLMETPHANIKHRFDPITSTLNLSLNLNLAFYPIDL